MPTRARTAKRVTVLTVNASRREYRITHGRGFTLDAAIRQALNESVTDEGKMLSLKGWTLIGIFAGHLRRRQLLNQITGIEFMLVKSGTGETHDKRH